MTQYHINKKGMAAICRKTTGVCPFNEHFESIEEARKAYESVNQSFVPNQFLKKKNHKTQYARDFTGIGSNGLTQNVEEFKARLTEFSKHIDQWAEYRKTDLDEDKYRPEIPEALSPYIQKNNYNLSLDKIDTNSLKSQMAEAMKAYYINEVFNSEDIDCFIDDDEINQIIKIE